jgi:hypothetical protein
VCSGGCVPAGVHWAHVGVGCGSGPLSCVNTALPGLACSRNTACVCLGRLRPAPHHTRAPTRAHTQIVLSDLGLAAVGYGLHRAAQAYGWAWLVKTYFMPVLIVNFWCGLGVCADVLAASHCLHRAPWRVRVLHPRTPPPRPRRELTERSCVPPRAHAGW